MIGLTIYTQIGTTATTVTVSYTNSSGTSGRTSTAVVIGGTGFREASRMILIPLQADDVGVNSVESVTLVASTTTAGNFGVTLFRPLYAIGTDQDSVVREGDFITGWSGGGISVVPDNACLFSLLLSTSINAAASGALYLSQS